MSERDVKRKWLLLDMHDHGERHVLPLGDLIAHDKPGDDCSCGPAVECLPQPDAADWWLITHHSLDGRELSE
jgi:hypothetical protein